MCIQGSNQEFISVNQHLRIKKEAVENGNGVIRAELPRNYDVASLKPKHVAQLVNEINNRPLKCLGYKTPYKIFQQSIK